MDSRSVDEWAKQVAALFIKELPIEYIQHIIDTEDYIIPIAGKEVKAIHGYGILGKLTAKAENAAQGVLNKYYTQKIREQITKQLNKPSKEEKI